jgi:hypothetical protein
MRAVSGEALGDDVGHDKIEWHRHESPSPRGEVALEIPQSLEDAINNVVTHHLATNLHDHGLLLTDGDLSVAQTEIAKLGHWLLTGVLRQCYPMLWSGEPTALEFEHGDDVARIGAALAFGAVTSTVLTSRRRDPERLARSCELLCATFNLGIGLIDGLCDGDAQTGEQLLHHIRAADLLYAAQGRRTTGWLSAGLPRLMATDPSVVFTVNVIEAFFHTLHDAYPEERGANVRRIVGRQLHLALESESQSVRWPQLPASRARLIECSRATSVLPFEIIETLTIGSRRSRTPSPGTLLGEAMWRIDDLVDLCDDARSGALNGVLLAMLEEETAPSDRTQHYRLSDVERLLTSPVIASAAALAVDNLDAGLRLTSAGRNAFVYFVQRYAALPPGAAS